MFSSLPNFTIRQLLIVPKSIYKIPVRFLPLGQKPTPGHAKKILQILNNKNIKFFDTEIFTNNNPPQRTFSEIISPNKEIIFSSYVNTPKDSEVSTVTFKISRVTSAKKVNTELTVLSNRYRSKLDDEKDIKTKQGVFYAKINIDLIVLKKNNKETYKNFLNLNHDPVRKDMITGNTLSKGVPKLMNNTENYRLLTTPKKGQEMLPEIINFYIDPYLPVPPVIVTALLERMKIECTSSRGFIFNIYAANYLKIHPSPEAELLLGYFILEKPTSPTTTSFISELDNAFKLLRNIKSYKNIKLDNIQIKAPNICNSIEAQKSIEFTGQPNNDLTINHQISNILLVLRGDIKQIEGNEKDLSRCYIRTIYFIEGFHDDTTVLKDRIKYTTNHLENFAKEQSVPELLEILRNDNISLEIKNKELNYFVYKHGPNKVYARFLILLIDKRTVSDFHKKNIDSIDPEDVKTVSSSAFSTDDKEGLKFKAMCEEFKATKSSGRLKKMLLENMFENWHDFKS